LLKWRALHLEAETPYVLARAGTTKNSKQARQPIPAWLAGMFAKMKAFRAASKTDRVFSAIGRWANVADRLKADLRAAKLPLQDSEGNTIFFHSLRNSYISFLADSGTPFKVVQKLARHSDPKLTFNTYARTFEQTEQKAINLLPSFGGFLSASFCATSEPQKGIKQDETGKTTPDNELKTQFFQKKQYPHGESNPGLQNENLIS